MSKNEVSAPPKRYGSNPSHRSIQKSRYWLITFNFPRGTKPDQLTANDKLNIRAFNRAAQVHPVTFCVFQGEVGEEGTYHLQAYAEFASAVTMPTIKKHFGLPTLHCEVRIGTQEQAIAYCTKEDTRASDIYQYGTPAKMNKGKINQERARTDLPKIWEALKQGRDIHDIIEQDPSRLRHVGMMQKAQYEALKVRKRTKKTQLYVLYGCAGTGKSTTAISLAEFFGGYFLQPADGKQMWWNGYDPIKHKTVILDEFTGSKMPLTFLNQLADSHDLRVQTKGGFLPFLAERVIITSNFHPNKWYDYDNLNKNLCYMALDRRIDTLVCFRLDLHIEVPGHIDRNSKRLHIEVEKGGFNRAWVKSPIQLDIPPTVPNTPEPGEPIVPDTPVPIRTLSKGKRKVIQVDSSEEQPRYSGYPYDSSEELVANEVLQESSSEVVPVSDLYDEDDEAVDAIIKRRRLHEGTTKYRVGKVGPNGMAPIETVSSSDSESE